MCEATLLALHGTQPAFTLPASCRFADLAIPEDGGTATARSFLAWLEASPQDALFLNDVSELWQLLPFLPQSTVVVMVVHDEGARYTAPALANLAALDRIVAVSHHVARVLERRAGKSLEKVVTIHNGVTFPPEPERPPREANQPLRLLYAGGIDFLKKGVQDLAPVLARTSAHSAQPPVLSIAGGHDQRLQAEFGRCHVAQRVTWLGRIPRSECLGVMAEHDVLLLSSRVEPFGMVTVEAMGMGCVPVAYDVPSGTLEIVTDGVSGLLARFPNRRSLADCVLRLDRDRQLLLRLSRRAMADARRLFTAERAAKEYVTLAWSAASGPREVRRVPVREWKPMPTRPRLAPRPGYRRAIRRFLESHPRLLRWAWQRMAL